MNSKSFILTVLAIFATPNLIAQDFPVADRQLYEFFQNVPVDHSLVSKKAGGVAKSSITKGARPDHVNNQATNFFPPIFNQSGGSCGPSANVAYMLCYEINTLNNRDGKHDPNYQFPSHFTWLACNSALPEQTITTSNGVPSVATYGGTTYSRYFGLQDTEEKDWGWMQGYDKWYSAMFNRAHSMGKFPLSMSTPEGKELARQWLWNHCGDEDFQTGGVFVIGLAAGPEFTEFPNTAANREADVIGRHYVTTWGPKYNHAMTVVGYDDRVEFDLDSNGVVGEEEKGETGAWIIANSWGDWCDAGTIYCPYAYTYCVKLSGAAWDPAFYYPRKNYRPLRTIKLLMDHSRRYEIGLCGGVAQDTTAQQPKYSTPFSHFNYSGAVKTGTDDIPMLGRWADGYHDEPMEFGYDLTDLTENVDRTKPVKYFFYITTNISGKGNGNIYKASIIDYEFEREGIEIPFRIDTVAILNNGNTTMISVIVPGEQTYKPVNLELKDQQLTWQAPQKSNIPLKGYAIYCDKRQIGRTDASTHTYRIADEGTGPYSVTAVYDYNGQDNESNASNAVYNIAISPPSSTNTALELKSSMITIPDAVPTRLNDATIEFWIKPYSLFSWNQQIGYGWGTFLFHTDNSGGISVGWNTGADRITSAGGLLKYNQWTHVAITIKGNVMSLYINGLEKNTLTSSNYSGLPAISNFKIGEDTYKFDGAIDEFRIWNTCRTKKEIYTNMRRHLANPSLYTGLVACLNMDTIRQGGANLLVEYGGGHNVDLTDVPNCNIIEDNTFLTGSLATFSAEFALSTDTISVGESVATSTSLPLSATNIEWQAEGSATPSTTINNPTFMYDKAGTYSITLKASNASGNSAETTRQVVVTMPAAPVADFEIGIDCIAAGERVSLINRSIGKNCSYTWSMPGADSQTATTTNASPTYSETGCHPVTLKVSNETGSSTITKYVTITNTVPVVDFAVSPAAIILGEKITLTDKTKYEPSKWMWTITNTRHNVGINGRNSTYTPTRPGVYDVSLTASNAIGSGSATLRRAFMVSNADPQNGLNFAGDGERVSFKSPVDKATNNFTIDYWLFPYSTNGAANLASDDGIFNLSTDSNGETTLQLNGKSVSSGEGYIIANEWHHYAVTYKAGTVIFYRDGEKFMQPSARLPIKSPVWTGNITMGDTNTPFYGMIDEFCFWSKSLTINELQATCNAPIANPDSMRTNGGLVVYYDFNQTTGNVNSLTGDDYLGTRIGFGPDGDAWTSSLGVFTLDFSQEIKPKDVTAEYLTNYKAPFLHSSTKTNTTNYVSRYWELLTDETQSKWQVENTVTDSTVTTGAHVDAYTNGDLCCTTGTEGFASSLYGQRIWQTITLPTGRYCLSITPNAEAFASTGSYIVVNKGDTLVDNKTLKDALAYQYLDDKQLTFDIMEEGSTVSLGLIFNIERQNTVAIEAFTLTQYPYEFIEADDPDAVNNIFTTRDTVTFTTHKGGIRCTGTGHIRIINIQGVEVLSSTITKGTFITLPTGIYIVNGKKIDVK